jgi:hypothetical protein
MQLKPREAANAMSTGMIVDKTSHKQRRTRRNESKAGFKLFDAGNSKPMFGKVASCQA